MLSVQRVLDGRARRGPRRSVTAMGSPSRTRWLSGISPTRVGRIRAWTAEPLSADRVRLGRDGHHLGVRRPDPAGHLPASSTSGTDGVTASEVAERFELHPNVARHHLDKLAAGGYLEVGVERPDGGGAGRPSKRYRATEHEVIARRPRPPRRRAGHPAGPGARALPPGEAEAMAEEVGDRVRPGHGRRHGRATRPSARSAPRCTPWPTPSPPTGSPPTPRSTATSCASSPSTARSAAPPWSTR